MSLLWVLRERGDSSALHRRGPWAEVHVVAGGGSNISDLWYHCLLLQGGPGSFREKRMSPRVRKRRSSSFSSFSSSWWFFVVFWAGFCLVLFVCFLQPVSVRYPGTRPGADRSPGPAEMRQTFVQGFQRPSRKLDQHLPLRLSPASACGQSRAWARIPF